MRNRVVLATALLALAPRALAENPNWPPPITVDRQQMQDHRWWPDDGLEWKLFGFTPDSVMANPAVPDYEKAAGIGMDVDRAWQLSIGDPRVVIAVVDSGFHWGERDLVNKWFLNRNELPAPNRADCVGTDPYDCNNDGVFNIQDYTTAVGHQQPDTATIADRTLLARADKGDVNHNGFLDPQDLIAIFSDGKDGFGADVKDGNGFVDDICGWDFLWEDNDPEDDIDNGGQGYSHGTGEARDSANEGNNGMGGIGTCPRCMVLPLRGSDSFVASGNNMALAGFYANQRGAKVVQAAQVTLMNSPMVQDMLDYTWAHGTLFVASSADETSAHPMFPASLEHTLAVNGVHYDGNSWDDPKNTTFINFANNTNWGGHLQLTASCTSASSEATGLISGIAGLIFSYGEQQGLHLTAGEVFQLATRSAYDIDVPSSLADPTKFPSGPGWDAHFSYGRADARNALEMVRSGRIPPEVDITPGKAPGDNSPAWFQVYDPKRTALASGSSSLPGVMGIDVDIKAFDAHDRTKAYPFDYVVEVARGLEPRDSDFHMLITGSGRGSFTGQAATVDLAAMMATASSQDGLRNVDGRCVTREGFTASHCAFTQVNGQTVAVATSRLPDGGASLHLYPDGGYEAFDAGGDDAPMADEAQYAYPMRYAATVRVRATTHYGDARGDVKGEYRKTIFVHPDDDTLPGFPLNVGASGEASPKLVDLDGDGKDELVLATADGALHVFKYDGKALAEWPGFPAHVAPIPSVKAHVEGGFPGVDLSRANQGIISTPAVGDVDGDGKPDIVVSTANGQVYVFGLDGQVKPNFPVGLTEATLPREVPNAVGRPRETGEWTVQAAGPLPDGGTAERLDRRNELERGFYASPVLADLNGDGKLDVIQAGMDGYVHVWTSQGTELPGFPVAAVDPRGGRYGSGSDDYTFVERSRLISTPAVGDLDGDGVPEIVVGSNEVYDNNSSARMYAIKADGTFLPGWPVAIKGPYVFVLPFVGKGTMASPVIADLDGDGVPEVINNAPTTSPAVFAASGERLFSGSTSPGAEAGSKGEPSLIEVANGTVADLDGDGNLDFIDATIPAIDQLTGASGAIRSDFDHQLAAWHLGRTAKTNKTRAPADRADAPMLRAFPRKVPDYQFLTNFSVADIDGDSLPEVVSSSGVYLVTAFNKDGVQPAGWPKFTGTWNVATPAIGDLDGDGKLDVVVLGRAGWLFGWKAKGRSDGNVQWDSFHHDAQNTGNVATKLEARHGVSTATPPGSGPGKGCGCTSADAGLLSLLGLAALGLRRRRT